MKGNKGFEYCSTWQLRSGWVFAEGPKSKKPLKRIESFSNALYLSWLSWVEEFWVMKGSCVQEMGEKRCFWMFNWWEQVDENEGSSDGERTFPFPSSFHPFFPYGGKIVLASDSPNWSSFCLRSDASRSASCVKQLQQIWRSVIGWWPWPWELWSSLCL